MGAAWGQRRGLAIGTAAATLVLVAVATMPQLLGTQVGRAFERVGNMDPAWTWLTALGFLGSVLGAAGAWRSAVSLCGARMSLGDACARYGTGSLVNSFAPARLGDAVRIGLFSRAVEHRDRLWSTGGAFAAISAVRALVLGLLVVVAAAMGAVPLHWLLVIGVLVGAAVAAVLLSCRVRSHGHVAHLLDAFRALAREPRRALRIAGWVALASTARIGATIAAATAVGIHHPLAATLIVIPALDVAGLFPLTPGNVGVTSGAIAVALQAHGVQLTLALSMGIAYHAVETLVGILFGTASVLTLARPSRPWLVAAATAGAGLALLGVGATIFVDLA